MVEEDGRGSSGVWTHNRVTGGGGSKPCPPRMGCASQKAAKDGSRTLGSWDLRGGGGKWMWANV